MNHPQESPLVSIIVRTKDRPKLLKRALQSISAQTYRPIEVVLVNDGGCDLDIDEIKAILGDVSLNYIRLEQNTGRAHAGNVGIENAKGEYIGFLDDDDEFYPEHVETLVSFLRQLDYEIAYADSEMLFKHYNPNKKIVEEMSKRIFSSKDFSYKDLFLENYIPLLSILFSRKVLSSVKGFDGDIDIYEDWDLLIRCAQDYPFYHIKKTTSAYVQWSKILQVAQSEEYCKMTERSYDKIIVKHKDKFVPEVIRYFRDKINKLEAHIIEKDLIIEDLRRALKEKDENIKEVEAKIKEIKSHLDFIKSGRGWKLLSKYYSVRDRLLSFLNNSKR